MLPNLWYRPLDFRGEPDAWFEVAALNPINDDVGWELIQGSRQFDGLDQAEGVGRAAPGLRGKGCQVRKGLAAGFEAVDGTRFAAGVNRIQHDHRLSALPDFHQRGAVTVVLENGEGRIETLGQSTGDDQSHGVVASILIADPDHQDPAGEDGRIRRIDD